MNNKPIYKIALKKFSFSTESTKEPIVLKDVIDIGRFQSRNYIEPDPKKMALHKYFCERDLSDFEALTPPWHTHPLVMCFGNGAPL